MPQRAKPVAVFPELPTQMEEDDAVSEMDVDTKRTEVLADSPRPYEASLGFMSEDEEDEEDEDEDEGDDMDDWLRLDEAEAREADQHVAWVRSNFRDDVDLLDTTMVAEYADEIFAHMEELEQTVMPNPGYMKFQTEIEWQVDVSPMIICANQ